MLCTKGDGSRRVVIFDLGLSRLVRDAANKENTLTGSHVALGTLECMAPEQILNARDVTERSDVYSVGLILYRAITGAYPFASGDERDLARRKLTQETPEIPASPNDPIADGLRTIITRATRRRPAQRYENARAMREDLTTLREMAKAGPAAKPVVPPVDAAMREASRARARMPTIDLEDRRPPAGSGRLISFFVGLSVFCALVGAALWWKSMHH
jgi:serine/threonine protein kinase